VLVRVRAQTCRAVFPDLELATVLVVTEYAGMASWSGLWDENESRHTLTRLDRVCNLLAYHVTQIGVLNALGS
jgi:hypothetical protein